MQFLSSNFTRQELRLSQTMGTWKTQEWGYPVTPAPPGVELWSWFHPSAAVADGGGVDATWKRLVNALSGLSCSSLNFLDKDKVTVSPTLSSRPTGAIFNRKTHRNSSLLRYGSLAREIVCTGMYEGEKEKENWEGGGRVLVLMTPMYFHLR